MKDFVGFRFGNIHTKDLNLLVVSSSDRYNKNLLPDPTDYTTDIVGSDGTYYFGQTYDKREFIKLLLKVIKINFPNIKICL